MQPTPTGSPEYVITDADGTQTVHDPAANDREANIKRAGQLLHQIQMKKQFERLMVRAGRNKHALGVRTAKNRKRGKLAKASRKANR